MLKGTYLYLKADKLCLMDKYKFFRIITRSFDFLWQFLFNKILPIIYNEMKAISKSSDIYIVHSVYCNLTIPSKSLYIYTQEDQILTFSGLGK